MNIQWKRMSGSSKLLLVICVVVIILVLIYIGKKYEDHKNNMIQEQTETSDASPDIIAAAFFGCDQGKGIQAIFYKDKVDLKLSDGRNMTVPQTMSADGARYANADESFVFWNKGKGAFVTEGTGKSSQTTFANCTQR